MHITSARVLEKCLLTPQLTRLVLAPETYLNYAAGQYLQLLLPNNRHPYSYSIANAPNQEKTYELHIRHSADNGGNQYLIDAITPGSNVTLQLPYGTCTLDPLDLQLPILFIAGGTGFAPIKAMLEQLQLDHHQQTTILIWRAKTPADLYLDQLVREWQTTHPWFDYIPQYKRQPIQAMLANHATHPLLSDWQIVLAGPFDMVYNLRDELIASGVPRQRLYADAFAFEQNT